VRHSEWAHSHVWHARFTCMTWPTSVWNTTNSHMWHDSSTPMSRNSPLHAANSRCTTLTRLIHSVPWLNRMCGTTYMYDYMCGTFICMTLCVARLISYISRATHIYVWHDLCMCMTICVARLISYVWHDSFIRMTICVALLYVWLYVWHDLFHT